MKKKLYGDWELISQKYLGRGGQAFIFKVKSPNREGIYALKSFRIKKGDTTTQKLERYKNEVNTLIELEEHRNIIKIIDKGGKISHNNFEDYYYVMELADGNLQKYLEQNKKEITVTDIYQIYDQIINAFIYIHSKNRIHRDIKPQNILFFGNVFKVADFGINLKLGDQRITKSDEKVGPRYYIAPELEEGRFDDVDERADIYSLGKLLYYLLSKGKIFYREKHREERYNLVDNYGNENFEAFNQFFDKTIVYEREMRYLSIDDVQKAFIQCKKDFNHFPFTIYFELNLDEVDNIPEFINGIPYLYDWLEISLCVQLLETFEVPFIFDTDYRDGELFGLECVFFGVNDAEFYEILDISEWWKYRKISFYEYHTFFASEYYDKAKRYFEKLINLLSNLNQGRNTFEIIYNPEKFYRFKEQYHSLKLEFNLFLFDGISSSFWDRK